MPYYKNIGNCEIKYHGVSIHPDEVKFFEKSVMDKNLMQVEHVEDSSSEEPPVRKRRSYNRKNVESKEQETTTSKVEIEPNVVPEPEISTEEESN